MCFKIITKVCPARSEQDTPYGTIERQMHINYEFKKLQEDLQVTTGSHSESQREGTLLKSCMDFAEILYTELLV